MSSASYRVYFYANIDCKPIHMNNNIDENIRLRVEEKYNKKNFKNYGYVDGIHNIEYVDADDTSVKNVYRGHIRPEDPTSSALFTVKIHCTMLVPIRGSYIYGTVIGVNEEIILVDHEKIRIPITKNKINTNRIRFNGSAYVQFDENDNITAKLERGSRVIVQILGAEVVNGQNKIIAPGILDSIVPLSKVEEIDNMEPQEMGSVTNINEVREKKSKEFIAQLSRSNPFARKQFIDNRNNNADSGTTDMVPDADDYSSDFDSADFIDSDDF